MLEMRSPKGGEIYLRAPFYDLFVRIPKNNFRVRALVFSDGLVDPAAPIFRVLFDCVVGQGRIGGHAAEDVFLWRIVFMIETVQPRPHFLLIGGLLNQFGAPVVVDDRRGIPPNLRFRIDLP
jgi:hypothetical protein